MASQPRHVLLNNVEHAQLRVITRRGAAWGDAVMAVPTFPAEFRAVQACYPIVFQAVAGGTGFQPLALFGWREGQNLFLVPDGQGERWDASYVPLAIERQPFLIGFDGEEPVIHLDASSPRLSFDEGEPVFLPQGGMSPYLDDMNSRLLALHEGLQATPAFIEALQRHRLLEGFAFEFEAEDGTLQRWSGFHTVHEERLAALNGLALEALHRAGHLEAIYMVLASLSRLRELADRACRPRVR
jgi:hypothetical protein